MAKPGRPKPTPERAERIRVAWEWALKHKAGGNKAELGRLLDVTGAAVSQWSSKNTPDFETVSTMAKKLLKTTYNDIVEGRWQPGDEGSPRSEGDLTYPLQDMVDEGILERWEAEVVERRYFARGFGSNDRESIVRMRDVLRRQYDSVELAFPKVLAPVANVEPDVVGGQRKKQ